MIPTWCTTHPRAKTKVTALHRNEWTAGILDLSVGGRFQRGGDRPTKLPRRVAGVTAQFPPPDHGPSGQRRRPDAAAELAPFRGWCVGGGFPTIGASQTPSLRHPTADLCRTCVPPLRPTRTEGLRGVESRAAAEQTFTPRVGGISRRHGSSPDRPHL